MTWAGTHNVSYLAWSWDTATCTTGPALSTSYTGTPTPYGAGLRTHLAGLAAGGAYVLDGYGNLDPATSGLAHITTSDTWPGWNIARAAALLPGRAGGYALEGWGGIHPFAVDPNPLPPAAASSGYWSCQDVTRGIAVDRAGTLGDVSTTAGEAAPFGVGTPAPSGPTTAALPSGAEGRGVIVTS